MHAPFWSRRTLSFLLLAAGVFELGVALWDLSGRQFYFEPFGLRISSWDAYKPFRVGMAAVVAALWLHDHDAPDDASWHRLARLAPWIAGAAAVASAAVAIHFGIRAAGGADAYGYVSQAYLWAAGRITIPNPLAPLTASVGPAVAPLGYQLARDPNWLIPIYAPGLPMMMAVALIVGGARAVYLVAPLLGGVTVWLTYRLATRVADARTAMMAAVLLAFSPIFIFQAMQPMSDVPVTACWMAAWVCATSKHRWAPIGAGLAVSAAVLTRPNLVPLALAIAWVVGRRTDLSRSALSRLALFAAGASPGCLFIALLNRHLYGSPLVSGYGPLATLYAWDRFDDNLRRYGSWLLDLYTPGILLVAVAPFIGRVRATLPMLAFAACLLFSYSFYFVFDSWPFLRFLLPAIPLFVILGSAAGLQLVARAPLSWRGAIVFLVCTLLPGWYLLKSRELTIFDVHRAEWRYAAVGDAIGRDLEPNAVVLTVLHSGSVRLYGDRATVRWDLVAPDNLDFTIKALREGGYVPYVVLEDWEEPAFRGRFAAHNRYGALDWPATGEYADATVTRIYALADRDRHQAGTCIITHPIGVSALRRE